MADSNHEYLNYQKLALKAEKNRGMIWYNIKSRELARSSQ